MVRAWFTKIHLYLPLRFTRLADRSGCKVEQRSRLIDIDAQRNLHAYKVYS